MFKLAYKQKRYDAGLCTWCEQPRDSTRILCADCRAAESQRFKERATARKAQGLCQSCGDVVTAYSPLWCRPCWFAAIALNRTGSSKNGRMIAEIFEEQQGLCTYTQHPLVLGGNAQLDHKIPVSRQGTHERDNLHWVDASIPRMKGHLTHSEFLALCRLIAGACA
jgi:hypothetical protein